MTAAEKRLATSIGRSIRKHRETAGLSRRRLSLDAGAVQSYVSHLEVGRRLPSIPMLYRLARELKTGVANLLPTEAP